MEANVRTPVVVPYSTNSRDPVGIPRLESAAPLQGSKTPAASLQCPPRHIQPTQSTQISTRDERRRETRLLVAMPAAPTSSKSKSYPCEECGRILSRQDHLERHRLTAHSKRGALESTCRACGRKFSRRLADAVATVLVWTDTSRDVLVRHYRTIHGTKCESRPKGRPRKAPKPPIAQRYLLCRSPAHI